MSAFRWRVWRIGWAWSPNMEVDGWRRIAGSLWWRT